MVQDSLIQIGTLTRLIKNNLIEQSLAIDRDTVIKYLPIAAVK